MLGLVYRNSFILLGGTSMKSLRILSRVLPLALLISAPLWGSRQAESSPESSAAALVPAKAGAPTPGKEHPEVRKLATKHEIQDFLKRNKCVAIKVEADWCGACTMSREPFARASRKYRSQVNTACINADNPECKEFMKLFGVSGLPTTIYIRKEEGSRTAEEFEKTMADVCGHTARVAKYFPTASAQPAPARARRERWGRRRMQREETFQEEGPRSYRSRRSMRAMITQPEE
jgi:thiol:disulfide interchange protein